VQKLDLKRVLSGCWFNRIVLVSWIISGAAIFVALKNIELIVHGQLYYYGLHFSSDWADPYRVFTWTLYLCLGLPLALSGVALVSSFFKDSQKIPEKRIIVKQKVKPPQQVPKVAPQSPIKEEPKIVEKVNEGGIPCPHCKKVFSRALVMLDFRGRKHTLVSVCPYCNYVLGNTRQEKDVTGDVQVASPDEKIRH